MTHPFQPSPEFRAAAWRGIVERLGRDPRRSWWSRVRDHLGVLWLVLPINGFIAVVFWSSEDHSGLRHAVLAFLLQIAMGGFVLNIDGIRNHPWHSVCTFWPFPEDAVVTALQRRVLRAGFWWGIIVAVGFGVFAATARGKSHPLLVILQVALLGSTVIPFGILQAWITLRWTWIRYYVRGFVCLGLALTSCQVFLPGLRPLLREGLGQHGDLLALLMPAGWLILPWSAWVEGGPLGNALFLLPIPWVLWAVPMAWRELHVAARFRDRILFEGLGEIPDDLPEEFADQVQAWRVEAEAADRPGPTANTETILSRAFLESPLAEPRSWIDRWTWRWWTPEQRLAAECMLRGWPTSWGGPLTWVGLAAIPCTWVSVHLTTRDEMKSWFLAAFISGLFAVGALVPWFSGFSDLGVLRLLPIRLHTVASLRWKHTTIRCLPALPLLGIVGAVTAWVAGMEAMVGALVGLQLAITPAVLSPVATLYGLMNEAKTRGVLGAVFKWFLVIVCLLNIVSLVLQFLPVVGALLGLFCMGMNLLLLRLTIRWLDALRIEPK